MESTNRRRVFSTFLECSQMTGVFYHSVIHGLGFFICFMIEILRAQNDKTRPRLSLSDLVAQSAE